MTICCNMWLHNLAGKSIGENTWLHNLAGKSIGEKAMLTHPLRQATPRASAFAAPSPRPKTEQVSVLPELDLMWIWVCLQGNAQNPLIYGMHAWNPNISWYIARHFLSGPQQVSTNLCFFNYLTTFWILLFPPTFANNLCTCPAIPPAATLQDI